MSLVFSHNDVVMRVDGDVLESFRRGAESHRFLLAWLAVQVEPGSVKGTLVVRIASAREDVPFYQVIPKPKNMSGSALVSVIRTEEEPLYRQFFAEVAQFCGRPAVL